MGVELSGISELIHPYRIERVAPDFHLVIFTLAGRACHEVDGTSRVLKKGQVWVSPAGYPQMYWVEADRTWSILWFHLATNERWKFVNARRPSIVTARWLEPLHRIVQDLLEESVNQRPDTITAGRALAELIGVYLDRELGVSETTATLRARQQLNMLWNQVNARLSHPWSMKTLARESHISPAHLYRLTARFHGITPLGKVTQLRIQRAQDLLRHPDYPVKLIAELVGYGTPFAFSRAFHRHTGVSPSAFRNKRNSP